MAKMLERLKIPFEFQKPLGSYVIDFYIPSQRVALEVDSTERWGTQRRSRARWRDQELERLGIKTVRIDKRLLAKPERILEILSANDLI